MEIDDLAEKGSYAFGIVLEAKVRSIVSMVKKYQPNCTLEQLQETVSRWLKDEWKKELDATIDSLKEIQKQKKIGAKVLTPGTLHNLRIYKRTILNLLEGE